MTSNNKAPEKVTVLTPKDVNPEVDRVLLDFKATLEDALQYFEGKALYTAIIDLMLAFIAKIRLKPDKGTISLEFVDVVDGLETLIQSAIDALEQQLKQEREASKDFSARAFGAETALEQRQLELGQTRVALRALTERVQNAEAELNESSEELAQARQQLVAARSSAINNMREHVLPVLRQGEKEIEYLQRLATTIGGMQSSFAASLGQLAGWLAAEAPKSIHAAPEVAAKPATPAIDDLTAEIDRRINWLDDVNARLEELAELQTNNEEVLDQLREREKFAAPVPGEKERIRKQTLAIAAESKSLVELKQGVEIELHRLDSLQEAIVLVEQGLPDLMGKALPEPDIRDHVVTVTTPAEKPLSSTNLNNDRYRKLAVIAQATGLSANGVLMVTLYDCVAGSTHKSAVKIVKIAHEAGILDQFGFASKIELRDNWRTQENVETRYVSYFGGLAGGCYRRGTEPLPWKPTDVLTETEIQGFVRTMAESKPSPRNLKKRRKSQK